MPRGGIKGNKGGQKGASGRKTAKDEIELKNLLDECWTVDDRRACIKKLATKAKGRGLIFSMEAVKILMAYAYGKPVEHKEINTSVEVGLTPDIQSMIDKIYGAPTQK